MRLAGKMCCNCKRAIEPPTGHGTYCAACGEGRAVHRVYMAFEQCLGVWRVRLKAPGPPLRELRFASADKVESMTQRGNALRTLADKQGLAAAIRQGCGGVELLLTQAQLAALRR